MTSGFLGEKNAVPESTTGGLTIGSPPALQVMLRYCRQRIGAQEVQGIITAFGSY